MDFYLFHTPQILCYNIKMYMISKSLAFLAILGLLLSGVPAVAMSCNHAQEATPVAKAEMPCHKKAAEAAPVTKTDKNQKSDMDCCGDLCPCAKGLCHAAGLAFIGIKSLSFIPVTTAQSYAATGDNFVSFLPEQATPPPRI